MDALNLTRRDIVCVLAACTLIPVACFIAGVLIAGSITAAPASATFADTATVERDEPVKEAVYEVANEPLTLLTEVPKTVSTGPAEQYLVQAGLFSTAQNAERYVGTLARKGISAQVVDTQRAGTRYYRVVIGTFSARSLAEAYLVNVERLHNIDLYVARVEAAPEYLASL